MRPRVLLVVTHLMGSGHLARTLAIARGLAAAGAEPVAASGGRPLPHLDAAGVRVERLPAVTSDGLDYSRLLRVDGAEADAAHMAARRDRLLALLDELEPTAVVTELFPFGRRILAAEFEALLEAARARAPRPRVFCSVRDLPEPPKKAKRAPELAARLTRFYDGVLVHGDAALAPIEAAWPIPAEVAPMIRHTGYVADPLPEPEGDPEEVLVAVGGGAIGRDLLRTAVEAARLGTRPWRLRVGGADAAAEAARLTALAEGAPVAVEPAAPDYRARLGAAAASVSLLGYNTAVDLLQTGTPAVVVPFATETEREQAIRAERFAARPQFEVLDAPSPETLAAAVARAVAKPRASAADVALDGVAETARLILEA